MNHTPVARKIWIGTVVVISLICIAATMLSFWPLNLRDENNLAALFSAMLLLLTGIHAYDGVAANRRNARPLAVAWGTIALVMVLLSFDEYGSLHERLPSGSRSQYWLWVLPFALGFVALGAFSIIRLFSHAATRRSSLLIFAGFCLFLLVALQEDLEWWVQWPESFKPIRAAIEEGTELLGMTLILLGTLANSRGLLSRDQPERFPVLEAVTQWRIPLLVFGLIAGPIIALWTVNLEKNEWGHGMPALWPPAVLFFIAGLAVLRPVLRGDRTLHWREWGLFAVTAVGCATTTLKVEEGQALLPLTAVSVVAVVLWLADRRISMPLNLSAAVVIAASLVVSAFVAPNPLTHYCSMVLTATAFYFVASASRLEQPAASAPPAAVPS